MLLSHLSSAIGKQSVQINICLNSVLKCSLQTHVLSSQCSPFCSLHVGILILPCLENNTCQKPVLGCFQVPVREDQVSEMEYLASQPNVHRLINFDGLF